MMISDAWTVFWKNWTLLVPLGFMVFACQVMLQQSNQPLVGITGLVLYMILSYFVYQASLAAARGKLEGFSQLTMGGLLPYVGAALLTGIFTMIGLVLLIVPGVYLAARFFFFPFYIIDEDSGIFSSLEESGHLSRGHIMHTIWVAIVCALLAVVPAAILIFGVAFLIESSGIIAAIVAIFGLVWLAIVEPLVGIIRAQLYESLKD